MLNNDVVGMWYKGTHFLIKFKKVVRQPSKAILHVEITILLSGNY